VDEIDRDFAYQQLTKENIPQESWRWRWASLTPRHFTECALYSPLLHSRDVASDQERLDAPPAASAHRWRKVFVVHGHDEGALQAAARFVERLGLEAIVLREQPDRGRAIIEKFEDCAAEVGFAIILLTPDDLAGPAGGPPAGAQARQNVIFELGYFAGKLGRGRTCLLRKGKVDVPSDLYGVIYTEMDAAEGWKRKLARELKEAGLDFDPAKVLA
jgi:predicted nucleotide-binding protein